MAVRFRFDKGAGLPPFPSAVGQENAAELNYIAAMFSNGNGLNGPSQKTKQKNFEFRFTKSGVTG